MAVDRIWESDDIIVKAWGGNSTGPVQIESLFCCYTRFFVIIWFVCMRGDAYFDGIDLNLYPMEMAPDVLHMCRVCFERSPQLGVYWMKV